MFFFFLEQKTAYEMRISDWSSDVCSSDLVPAAALAAERHPAVADLHRRGVGGAGHRGGVHRFLRLFGRHGEPVDVAGAGGNATGACPGARSGESRVGKECVSTSRSRWAPDH